MNQTQAPTIFIIFGVTGDLSQRKLLPALFDLFVKGYLPETFRIIGFSRRTWTHEEFQTFVRGVLCTGGSPEHPVTRTGQVCDSEQMRKFLETLLYQEGHFEDKQSYRETAKLLRSIDMEIGRCTNKLFYLAVPPIAYEQIFLNLAHSGLTIECSDETGWTRVLVEKPFGKDLGTARSLDTLLGSLFREEQLFRIDHYLAKEALQNILLFRFSNSIFEPVWNNQWIERVEIKLFETADVSRRGELYDDIGALRDVGQNHILQMIALIAMNHPGKMEALHIRQERADVLRRLQLAGPLAKSVSRGQYEGYKHAEGVRSDSMTETYFRVRVAVDNDRWRGVPFILESGKALKENRVEIVVHFKPSDPCFCPGLHEAHEHGNKITFSIQPEEKIEVRFWTKRPGIETTIVPRDLSFGYAGHDDAASVSDAYEKVLYDCIIGDQTLFASTEEIDASWRFITPILTDWKHLPLHIYAKGSEGECVVERV